MLCREGLTCATRRRVLAPCAAAVTVAVTAAATLPAGVAAQTISAQAFLDAACNGPAPVGSVTITDGTVGTFSSACAITMGAGEDLDWGARVRVTLPPTAALTVTTPGASTEAEILVGPGTTLSAGAISLSTSADIIIDAGGAVRSIGSGGVTLATPTTLRLGGALTAGGGAGGSVSATAGGELLLGPSGSVKAEGDVTLVTTGGLALQAADVTAAATTAVRSIVGKVSLTSTGGNVEVGAGVIVRGGSGLSATAAVELLLAQTPSSSPFVTTLAGGKGGDVSVGGGEKTIVEEGVVIRSAGALLLGSPPGGEVLVKGRASLTAAGALTLDGDKCTVEPGAKTVGNPVTVC